MSQDWRNMASHTDQGKSDDKVREILEWLLREAGAELYPLTPPQILEWLGLWLSLLGSVVQLQVIPKQ